MKTFYIEYDVLKETFKRFLKADSSIELIKKLVKKHKGQFKLVKLRLMNTKVR